MLLGANDLNEVADSCRSGGALCTQAKIDQALARFGAAGNGALADVGAGAGINIGRAVVFLNQLAYIGGAPAVDPTRTSAAACPGGATCITNNQSRFVLRGGSFSELGIGYGHELWESGFVVGGTLKGILGKVGYNSILIAAEEAGSGNFSDFKNTTRTSFQPGFDVGALWDVRETFPGAWARPRVGLTVRNLNNPKFKQPDAAVLAGDRGKFSLHGQARMGAAFSPLPWWHLVGDFDLTDNVTNVGGFKSQYLSAGTEINVVNRDWFNIPLRAGLQKNISDADSGVSWTGGVGFHLIHLTFDLGFMVSSRSTQIESETGSEKVPNNFAASAQFGILFGGHDDGGRNK